MEASCEGGQGLEGGCSAIDGCMDYLYFLKYMPVAQLRYLSKPFIPHTNGKNRLIFCNVKIVL